MLSRCLPIAVLAGLLAGGMSPALAQLRLPSGWQIELGASAHVAGYSGDIGHKGQYGVLSDTQWNLVQMGGGLSLRGQQKGQRIGWNLDVRRIRIQGADSMSNNAVAFVRNLHFRNEMTEVAMTADLPLLRLGGRVGGWTLGHAFRFEGGLALLHHAPMAQVDVHNLCYDVLNELGFNRPGQWHDLRTQQTEGVDYAEWVMTVPLGFSYTFSADPGTGKPWHVTLSGLWRFTRTDYLDDIHNRYSDPWQMSPLGLALSSQANPQDLPPCAQMPGMSSYQYQQGIDPARQAVRGNASTRDHYWTVGLTVARSLTATPANAFHKRRFRGQRVENKR